MSAIATIAIGAGVAVAAGAGAAYLKAGGKPKIPNFPNLDLAALMKAGALENKALLPFAQGLASNVNAANRAEVLKARESAVPGAIGQIQKNISNQLSGIADAEDTRAAIRNATAANFRLGAGGGSQFSKFAVVGNLGRTVAQQRQQGFQNFTSFASTMDAPKFDPSSMFLTPQMRVEVARWQAQGQHDVNLARANIAAQPSAGMQALAGGLGALSSVGSMAAGYGMGGMMGGAMAGIGSMGGGNPAPSGSWAPTSLTGSMGSTAPAGSAFPGVSSGGGGGGGWGFGNVTTNGPSSSSYGPRNWWQ